MERYTIEVREEAAASLRDAADANGVSVEEELRGLVERTFTPVAAQHSTHGDNWVQELIDLAGGVGLELPPRRNIPSDREPFGAD